MISNNGQNKQLPNELTSTFKELQVLKHLRKAEITKSFGFSCGFLFQLIFCLIFENKNWFRTLESKKSADFPAKDAVYHFLNKSTFAWRRFLLFLSAHTISKVTRLSNHDRPKVLVLDDSSYDRNRSKSVELLARCFDHASQKMRFYKVFRMLTLGWSDGATFIPVDFSLLSSTKNIPFWKNVVTTTHNQRKGCFLATILPNSHSKNETDSYISRFFKENKVGTLLNKANVRKEEGVSSLFLIQFIFSLVLHGKNLYRILDSGRIQGAPAKEAKGLTSEENTIALRRWC